jgi:hypothetical protein
MIFTSLVSYRSTGSQYWFLAVIVDVVVLLAGLLMFCLGILKIIYQDNEAVIYGYPLSSILVSVGLINIALATMPCLATKCRLNIAFFLYLKSCVLVFLTGFYIFTGCLLVYFISDLKEFVAYAYDGLLNNNQEQLKHYLGCVDKDTCVNRLYLFILKSFWVSLVLLGAFVLFLGLSARVSYLMAKGMKRRPNIESDIELDMVVLPTIENFELLMPKGELIENEKAGKKA